MKRREFFHRAACGMAVAMATSPRVSGAREDRRRVAPAMEPRQRSCPLPAGLGTYYEAEVPDTLDLAERARLGLQHITSIISEKYDYEMFYAGPFMFFNKPVLMLTANSLMACQSKFMEALAYVRLMTGSDIHLEREARMLEMMASHVGEEGIYWVCPSPDKPWLGDVNSGPYAHVHGQGDMIHAMIAWHQYTGDPKWKDLVDRMVDGVDRLMLAHKDDYAYFPIHGVNPSGYFNSCYYKDRGWRDNEEPKDEKHGEEGSLFVHQGRIAEALANWYLLTGNRQALRVSGELVRFYMKPAFWADFPGGEYPGVIGAEHAHWQGHYHGYVGILQGILAYARATNDASLKAFVRDGYEWTRQAGLACIGLVGDSQGCGCARLIKLAIMLTDAGIGDYWEDVDLYVRNHATEMQLVPEDLPNMEKWTEGKPDVPPGPPHVTTTYGLASYVTDGASDFASGGFGGSAQKSTWWACCSPWGNMGLFFAWDGTLRYADGVARVNLLLNRASPWMDVNSFLPHEGKVVLRNKEAKEAWARIPLWVNQQAVQCRIGNKIVSPVWLGRHLRFEGLKKGDELTIEFPIEERMEHWTSPPPSGYCLPVAGGGGYAIRFRGNTVIELDPPLQLTPPEGPGCWLYQDRPERYRATKAPMKQVTRFVTPLVLSW